MKFEFEYFSYTVYLGCITICCVNKLCDINAEPYNIALGKPTDQGPATYCTRSNGCCSSELAVDGKLGQDPSKGECSHTKKIGTIQGSWWSVNFQGLYYLASIRILRRYNGDATCCVYQMRGLSITGMTGNQEIFRDSDPTLFYGKADISINVPASLEETKFSGINISIPGSLLSLCEVWVYLARPCNNNLPPITNGDWVSDNIISGCHYYGCSFTVNCTAGYTPSGSVNITTTCSENGSWTTPVGTCQARSCGYSRPSMSNGYWISLDADGSCYYYKCSYSFHCDAGYIGTGTQSFKTYCESNGKWTTPEETCQAISCGYALQSMSYGEWIPHDTNGGCNYYKCSYTLSCTTGYTPSGTNAITTECRSDGEWSVPTGTCDAIECPVMNETGANYKVTNSLDRATYNTQLTAECLKGFEHTSGNLNRTCLATGTWSGTELNCTIIKCPVRSNRIMNYLIKNDTVDFIYQDILAYQCNSGFELSSGNLTRHCQASGDWSGEEPNCTEVRNTEESSSDNAAALGGSFGGVLVAIAVMVIVVFVLFRRRKRDKPNVDDLYETRLHLDEPRLYTVLDETVRTESDAGGPEQIDNAIVNTEYESCEEIKQSNHDYINLQICERYLQKRTAMDSCYE